jgi:hypothetical protein
LSDYLRGGGHQVHRWQLRWPAAVGRSGGEAWRRGLPYFVQWDDNLLKSVIISLYQAGTLVKTITTNAPGIVSYQRVHRPGSGARERLHNSNYQHHE